MAKDRRWELEVSALVTWLDHGPKPCMDRHVLHVGVVAPSDEDAVPLWVAQQEVIDGG